MTEDEARELARLLRQERFDEVHIMAHADGRRVIITADFERSRVVAAESPDFWRWTLDGEPQPTDLLRGFFKTHFRIRHFNA